MDSFYDGIDALIEELRAGQHDDEARLLQAIMHETAYTTGSKLIGELAAALTAMRGGYSFETQAKITRCLYFARHHRRILRLDETHVHWIIIFLFCVLVVVMLTATWIR